MENYIRLKVVVDRFEGKFALLRTAEGEEIHLPIKLLPPYIKEGNIFYLRISSEGNEEKEKEKLAKSILNEILKTEEE